MSNPVIEKLFAERIAHRKGIEAKRAMAIAAELQRQFVAHGVTIDRPGGELPAAYVAWCDAIGAQSMPATPATVALYLMTQTQDAPALLADQIAAISLVHQHAGLADPTASPEVRAVMNFRAKVVPPRSWPKESWSMFELLPYGLQTYIVNREKTRDAEVRRAQNKAAAATRKEQVAA